MYTPVTTVETLMDLIEPLTAGLIYDNHNDNEFTCIDQTNHAAATAWNTLPANQDDSSTIHQWSQTIADAINMAGHAIEFSSLAACRDLMLNSDG